MMLEMSLGEASLAKKLAGSVELVLKEGRRTKDLASDNEAYLKTSEFGENVEHAFRKALG
jgi:isocitrate/isopropylmalate dehydrogenase